MKLKLMHIIISAVILPICFLMFVSYGWSAFAMVTGRSGLNGSAYLYYGIGKLSFISYTLIVALAAFVFGAALANSLIKKTSGTTTRIFWGFLIFLSILVLFNLYLNTTFTGKG
jgi:hypothetical protein